MLLSELAAAVGGTLHNVTADFEIEKATSFDAAGEHDICVVASSKLNKEVKTCKAGALIVGTGNILQGHTCIEVAEPWIAMVMLLEALHPPMEQYWFEGLAKSAFIHPTAVLGEGVTVAPNAVIGPETRIGAGTVVCPGVVIGRNVTIGDDCIFEPNCVIEANTRIGKRCIIHAGAVIGSDGFKYEIVSFGRIKIPQVGCVVIGDDCEIGSCTCIDRAGFTETRIGARTKIDNQVQVGHNVVTGTDCCLVSQSGVAGSTKLGNWVILAAKAGIADHLTLGDGSIVMAGTGVMRNVGPKEYVLGMPARPARQTMKIVAATEKLPDLVKEVNALRKRIEELEKQEK